MDWHEVKHFINVPKVGKRWRTDLAGQYPDRATFSATNHAKSFFIATDRRSVVVHRFFGRFEIVVPMGKRVR
jgi:hypothetical protein